MVSQLCSALNDILICQVISVVGLELSSTLQSSIPYLPRSKPSKWFNRLNIQTRSQQILFSKSLSQRLEILRLEMSIKRILVLVFKRVSFEREAWDFFTDKSPGPRQYLRHSHY